MSELEDIAVPEDIDTTHPIDQPKEIESEPEEKENLLEGREFSPGRTLLTLGGIGLCVYGAGRLIKSIFDK